MSSPTNTIRLFLGRSGAFGDDRYEYQTIFDNLRHVSSQLLVCVNQLLVESGHAVARKIAWRNLAKPLRF